MNLGFSLTACCYPHPTPPQFLKITIENAVPDWKDSLIFFSLLFKHCLSVPHPFFLDRYFKERVFWK